MAQQTPVHKVLYRGTYSYGDNGEFSYRIGLNVPEPVVKNANILGWFKEQMRDPKSDAYKTFVKQYPDFAVLTTFAIDDLSQVQNA